MPPVDILGISAYYHDSAACLLRDGRILAAAQEERFSRRRHDPAFPSLAVRFCLEKGGIGAGDLTSVAFYDKPLLKFERLLETYIAFAPRGIHSFIAAMPVWLKDKLLLRRVLRDALRALEPEDDRPLPPLLFSEHHESHAASAFYPSPFESAAVLSMDGVGEWATGSGWVGEGAALTPLWEIPFPHSLGLLYSAFTYQTGFRVNSGEYKLMGLAPYGEPTFVQAIYDHLVDLKPDGTFRLNMEYFDYCVGRRMTNRRFDALFGGPPRTPESPLAQRDKDLARSIQEVTGEIMLRLARTLHRETGRDCLALAGGVALNSVANGRILREGPFRSVWVQPAAGDAGGALGAACRAWHGAHGAPRSAPQGDAMCGAYLGPEFSDDEIEGRLRSAGAVCETMEEAALVERVSAELAAGRIVGWFQGAMEFGPRALGNRSILGDPRDPEMQSILNLRIKRRESFRPFAPSVSSERARDYFLVDGDSPYMSLVAPVGSGTDLPAVTHVDGSARLQTVHAGTNPRFHRLLEEFGRVTGVPVLVNTSFNVRGEPIVCTPEDTYRCFMDTGIDVLAAGRCLLYKDRQNGKPVPVRIEPVPRPETRALRTFAVISAAALSLIAVWGAVFSQTGVRSWALVAAALLVLAALAAPRILEWPYRIWIRIGAALGWINTRVLLSLVYYGLLTPVGFLWRLTGRDPLRRRFDPGAGTYRLERAPRAPSHMQRQY